MRTGVGFSPTSLLSLLSHARSLSPGEPSPFVGLVSGLAPPGEEELYFYTEPFPGNAPSAPRGRGKHRLRDKPVAAAHSVWLAIPPGPPGSRGAAAAPAPLGRRTFGRVPERAFREEGGRVPSQPQSDTEGELVPRTSARQPNSLGKVLTLLLRRRHSADEKSARGRARVLANIYSEVQNCFAFLFVIW